MTEIHIPEGINFECTGCGNCCLSWPVPVTGEDYQRISAAGESAGMDHNRLFRPLRARDSRLQSFAYTLEKRADGRCEFLTEDSRCALHAEYGPAMKPAMCQLFPYTFSETPTGVYASMSFASSGVLFNSGRALADQRPLLEDKWREFRRLFPDLKQDWSQVQLVDGYPLTWNEYLDLEMSILKIVRGDSPPRLDRRLSEAGKALLAGAGRAVDAERAPPLEARPKVVDQILLAHLFEFYLPDDVFACDTVDLDARTLMEQLVRPPAAVAITCGGRKFGFQELKDCVLGALDAESEDLLSRFVYCRVFAKLYFGAGFGGLSVLSGWNHLSTLVALTRLKIKTMVIARGRRPDFLEIAELVRSLERRLTQVALSGETKTVFEVLLKSPERLGRSLFLAD